MPNLCPTNGFFTRRALAVTAIPAVFRFVHLVNSHLIPGATDQYRCAVLGVIANAQCRHCFLIITAISCSKKCAGTSGETAFRNS